MQICTFIVRVMVPFSTGDLRRGKGDLSLFEVLTGAWSRVARRLARGGLVDAEGGGLLD